METVPLWLILVGFLTYIVPAGWKYPRAQERIKRLESALREISHMADSSGADRITRLAQRALDDEYHTHEERL